MLVLFLFHWTSKDRQTLFSRQTNKFKKIAPPVLIDIYLSEQQLTRDTMKILCFLSLWLHWTPRDKQTLFPRTPKKESPQFKKPIPIDIDLSDQHLARNTMTILVFWFFEIISYCFCGCAWLFNHFSVCNDFQPIPIVNANSEPQKHIHLKSPGSICAWAWARVPLVFIFWSRHHPGTI